jgi:hypothetical protein
MHCSLWFSPKTTEQIRGYYEIGSSRFFEIVRSGNDRHHLPKPKASWCLFSWCSRSPKGLTFLGKPLPYQCRFPGHLCRAAGSVNRHFRADAGPVNPKWHHPPGDRSSPPSGNDVARLFTGDDPDVEPVCRRDHHRQHPAGSTPGYPEHFESHRSPTPSGRAAVAPRSPNRAVGPIESF